MNKFSIILLLFCCFNNQKATAQYQHLVYNYELNTFEGNVRLPNNERFIIKGDVKPHIESVTIEFYKKFENPKSLVFQNSWFKSQNINTDKFTIDIYDGLPSDDKYDIKIKYFAKRDSIQTKYVNNELGKQIKVFIENNLELKRKSLKWSAKPNDIFRDLNSVIANSLSKTIEDNQQKFKGLSGLIANQIKGYHNAKLTEKRDNQLQLEEYNEKVNSLLESIQTDINFYLNTNNIYLIEEKMVYRYPVKKSIKPIAFNAGYGITWFRGGVNNFSIGHAPYVGFAFPVTRKYNAKTFWKNLSINTGVYLLNFKDKEGNVYSGPVIKRPIYLNFGYTLFKFLKFQGGATLLEKKINNGNFVNGNQITVRPNISVGVELGFWLGIKK